MQFFVGLHEDYRNVRGNILMIKPLPSLDQVYQIVLQEEKQRALSSTVSICNNFVAFHSHVYGDYFKNSQFQQRPCSQGTSKFNPTPNTSYQQSNPGSYKMGQKNLVDKNYQEKRTYFCDYCRIPGHSTQRCFKLHGYPPRHKLYRGRKIAAAVQT